jgi:membrane-bound metal-dependent hydrolase YbcI (DUF457 family)
MDPPSHLALGVSLGAIVKGDSAARGVIRAALIGSLLPDADAVVMPFGWDRYLRVHEIGTHSIGGVIACALVAMLASGRSSPHTDRRMIGLAALAGAAGHVVLDLVSSARIRAFWPLHDAQLSIPLVAMADPWLAAILLTAAVALWRTPRRRRAVAATLLTCAAGFLAIKAALAASAMHGYTHSTVAAADYFVEARWATLREWHVFDRTSDRLRHWRAARGEVELMMEWPSPPESPLETASRRQPAVRNFVYVHQLAFPVTVALEDGRTVLWSDLRFCWKPAGNDSPRFKPVVPGPDGALVCALWVGVEFDAGGRARRQVVHVFGFTQTRAPAD